VAAGAWAGRGAAWVGRGAGRGAGAGTDKNGSFGIGDYAAAPLAPSAKAIAASRRHLIADSLVLSVLPSGHPSSTEARSLPTTRTMPTAPGRQARQHARALQAEMGNVQMAERVDRIAEQEFPGFQEFLTVVISQRRSW